MTCLFNSLCCLRQLCPSLAPWTGCSAVLWAPDVCGPKCGLLVSATCCSGPLSGCTGEFWCLLSFDIADILPLPRVSATRCWEFPHLACLPFVAILYRFFRHRHLVVYVWFDLCFASSIMLLACLALTYFTSSIMLLACVDLHASPWYYFAIVESFYINLFVPRHNFT